MAGKRQSKQHHGASGASTPPAGDDTVELIERAAMELLREQGVLAGLNMREVADRAGVNRGLVYYHFGTRQDLLRAAIERSAGPVVRRLRFADGPTPIEDRARNDFEVMVSGREMVGLLTLLVLDGQAVDVLPNLRHQLAAMSEDQEAGELDPELDPKLVLAAMHALSIGYTLYRDRFARELWIEPEELDRRLGDVVARLFGALRPSASAPATAPRAGTRRRSAG